MFHERGSLRTGHAWIRPIKCPHRKKGLVVEHMSVMEDKRFHWPISMKKVDRKSEEET